MREPRNINQGKQVIITLKGDRLPEERLDQLRLMLAGQAGTSPPSIQIEREEIEESLPVYFEGPESTLRQRVTASIFRPSQKKAATTD